MQVIQEEGSRPIKAWVGTREIEASSLTKSWTKNPDAREVVPDIEPAALQQLKNIARLPFIHPNGVAVMPDVHLGKGAIRARKGDLGIIPGSMGQRSFIVRGKGNPESYCSCSHGAGRVMSRAAAKRKFSLQDLIAQTEGVECRKTEEFIDEIPSSYKDIDAVMANQTDLIEVVHVLKQVLCVKGAS